MTLVMRIVARYTQAKVSFVPEFKKVLDAYERGDTKPAKEFIPKVLSFVDPGGRGKFTPWFYALGTTQRGKVQKVFRDGHTLLSYWLDDKHLKSETWHFHVVAMLEAWGSKLKLLETLSKAEDEDRIIQRGGFSIVPMPGVSKATADAALEALDAAASKIRPKFPEILYGKIFFATSLGKSAARYIREEDTIHLSTSARKGLDDVYSLIHEFGHRFDHKVFSVKYKDLRQRFFELSMQKVYETIEYDALLRRAVAEELVTIAKARKDGMPFLGMSRETEYWAKELGMEVKRLMSDYLAGRLDDDKLLKELMGSKDVTLTTDKLLHGPLSVTSYGATKPSENFAEAFAHYVLGMKMPQEFIDIFAKLS